MKLFLKALLSDTGDVSMLRVLALVSVLMGAALGLIGILMGKDLGGVAQVCAVFVTSALAAKVGQKFIEK